MPQVSPSKKHQGELTSPGLMDELTGAKDSVRIAVTEIERLQDENNELHHTIDSLREWCFHLETENLDLLESCKMENQSSSSGKLTRNGSRRSLSGTTHSSSTANLDQSAHDSCQSFELFPDDDFSSPPPKLPGGNSSSRLGKISQSLRDFRFDSDNDNDVEDPTERRNHSFTTSSPQGQSGPLTSSSPAPKQNWFQRKKLFKQTQTETEAVLLRQLDVLQEDKTRQIAELELKLQQREAAILTLEQSITLKDSTIKILRNQFENGV